MKKIISLLLILTLVFALVACGGDEECTEHVDVDPTDGYCDSCNAELNPVTPGGTPVVPVTPDMFG